MDGQPPSPSPASPPVPRPEGKPSALASVSLVATAVFCLLAAASEVRILGLLGLASLAAGLLAIHRIRRSGGRLTGLSLALAGVLVSALLLVGTGASLYGQRMKDLAARRARLVERDLTRLTSAVWKYSAKHGHQLPPAESWRDVLDAEGFLRKDAVGAPAEGEGARHYAMNVLVGGLPSESIKDRAGTVLFYECEKGAPEAGGPGNLRRHTPYGRYPRGHVVAFADGHCEFRTARELDSLNWLPQGKLVCPGCGQEVRLPRDWTPEKGLTCPSCALVLRELRGTIP